MRTQLLFVFMMISFQAFSCDSIVKLFGEVVFDKPKVVSEVGEFNDIWSENDNRYSSILLDTDLKVQQVELSISKDKNKVLISQKTVPIKINGKEFFKIKNVNFYSDIANRSITYPYSLQVKFSLNKKEYCSKKIILRGEG